MKINKILLLSDTHQSHHNEYILKDFYKNIPETFDIIIHAGDWITSNQDELQSSLETIRSVFPDHIILSVIGNHDFWNKKFMTHLDKLSHHRKMFKKYNIHHLEKSIEFDNIFIQGFDGWYGVVSPLMPPTWDKDFMNNEYTIHFDLNKKAYMDLQRIIYSDNTNKIKICVTHFPSILTPDFGKDASMIGDLKYMDYISDRFNYLLCGHTHRYMDTIVNECRILNCGCDYDIKDYIILDLNNGNVESKFK